MVDHDAESQYSEVVGRAEDAPYGNAKVALWEEAVRLADSLRDDALAFQARMELTNAAQFSGRPDVSLVSFSWCLAYADRHADEIDPRQVLWHYKWMAGSLPDFPDVPRSQIAALMADLTKRLRAQGSTLHAVYQIRRNTALKMYDTRAARAAHKKFLQTERDEFSNCKACVQNADVSYQIEQGDDAAAAFAAAPILKGKMSCTVVPHSTYGKMLLPYLRLGKPAEAMRCHKVGYPLVKANPVFLYYHGKHMALLALTGNNGRAAQLLNRHLPTALVSPMPDQCFHFYRDAVLTLELLMESPRPPIVRVPPGVPGDGSPVALRAWLDNELSTLAGRFDERNGNAGYTDDIAAMQATRSLATKFPYAAE